VHVVHMFVERLAAKDSMSYILRQPMLAMLLLLLMHTEYQFFLPPRFTPVGPPAVTQPLAIPAVPCCAPVAIKNHPIHNYQYSYMGSPIAKLATSIAMFGTLNRGMKIRGIGLCEALRIIMPIL
jgi:hypothetical protein